MQIMRKNNTSRIHLSSVMSAYIAWKYTFKEPNGLEREPLWYCKCLGNVTFTRPSLTFSKATFYEVVNVLEGYCKSDISDKLNLNGSLSKT